MKHFTDYIYYRISKLYYKYDNGLGIYAMVIITMTEGLLLLDIFLLIERYISYNATSSNFIGPLTVVVAVLPLSFFNYLRYIKPKNKYDQLHLLYKNESTIKRNYKGFLVLLSLLAPWLLLFIVNSFIQYSF